MKPIQFKVPFSETPNEIHSMPGNEFDILADDGRTLFTLRLNDDGTLIIEAGMTAKHNDVMLAEQLTIMPLDSRRIEIRRIKHT